MVSILTAADWPVIGQICWVLGKVMDLIYTGLDYIMPSDAGLVGLSIIVYTIFVYTLMLPITISQQRSTRLTSAMNPELQAIQKKYKNKNDQASMQKQQDEMQAVYDKYGTSMWSGCLPMLIQLPLLFALYPVIYNIDRYVPALETAPAVVNQFLTIPDMTVSPWDMLQNSASYTIPQAAVVITAIALPVISGATQYLSIKLSQSMTGQTQQQNSAASSMRWMNMFMPLFSVWLVFTLASGIGLYWIVAAIYRSIQQVLIDRYLKKTPIEEVIAKNQAKAEKKAQKKREKKGGAKAEEVNAMARTSTRNLAANHLGDAAIDDKEKQQKLAEARENAANAKEGSLTARANMVQRYNKNSKSK